MTITVARICRYPVKGKAELLNGLSATTHRGAVGLLKEAAPNTAILGNGKDRR